MEGELRFFLGLQIRKIQDGIFVNQPKFAKDLVSKFGLNELKPFDTPISTSLKITKDASGPDISFNVGACVRHQVDPKESHLKTAKRIIRLTQGTIEYGLWYPFDTNSEIIGYTNVD